MVCVLKFVPFGKTKGELTVLCCASTAIVDDSKTMGPEMNCEPSGETANTDERLPTVRERSTVDELTSYTKTARELFANRCAPIIVRPSVVA